MGCGGGRGRLLSMKRLEAKQQKVTWKSSLYTGLEGEKAFGQPLRKFECGLDLDIKELLNFLDVIMILRL